jgi:hypothetical protein
MSRQQFYLLSAEELCAVSALVSEAARRLKRLERTGANNAFRAASDQVTPIVVAVVQLIGQRGAWGGTATELLETLNREPRDRKAPWPSTARALSGRLRRAAPILQRTPTEIRVDFRRTGHPGGRRIFITTDNPQTKE